jgi:hypothetical protein
MSKKTPLSIHQVLTFLFLENRSLKAQGAGKDEIKAAVAALNTIKDKIETLVRGPSLVSGTARFIFIDSLALRSRVLSLKRLSHKHVGAEEGGIERWLQQARF